MNSKMLSLFNCQSFKFIELTLNISSDDLPSPIVFAHPPYIILLFSWLCQNYCVSLHTERTTFINSANMRANINHKSTNFYWNQVKDLSPEMKLDLISRLSQSIIVNVDIPQKKTTLDECFAAWSTDDNEYSDDMLLHDIDAVCGEKDDFVKDYL